MTFYDVIIEQSIVINDGSLKFSDGFTASAMEINILDGVENVTKDDINTFAGVASHIGEIGQVV